MVVHKSGCTDGSEDASGIIVIVINIIMGLRPSDKAVGVGGRIFLGPAYEVAAIEQVVEYVFGDVGKFLSAGSLGGGCHKECDFALHVGA